MHNLAIIVAAAGLGIDTGWEEHPAGGYVYTIQISPEVAQGLLEGRISPATIELERPVSAQVRRFRLQIGTGDLPRAEVPPLRSPVTTASDSGSGVQSGPPPRDEVSPPAVSPRDIAQTPPNAVGEPRTAEAPVPMVAPGSHQEPRAVVGSPNGFSPGFNPSAELAQAISAGAVSPVRRPTEPKIDPTVQPSLHQTNKIAHEHAEDDDTLAGPAPAESSIPITMWLVLLIMSVAANLYLGWVVWNQRTRYWAILEDLQTAT